MASEKEREFLQGVHRRVLDLGVPDGLALRVSSNGEHLVLNDGFGEVHVCYWPLRQRQLKQLQPRIQDPVVGYHKNEEEFIGLARDLLED